MILGAVCTELRYTGRAEMRASVAIPCLEEERLEEEGMTTAAPFARAAKATETSIGVLCPAARIRLDILPTLTKAAMLGCAL